MIHASPQRCAPPSMYQHSPFTKDASSEAMYAASWATSAGVPRRFIGVFRRLSSTSSGGYCSVPVDRMIPGAIALTWMLCCAHSTARVFAHALLDPCARNPVWTIPGKPRAMCDDVDDSSAARGDHVARRDRLRDVEGAVQVVADDRVPALRREVLRRRSGTAPCVVLRIVVAPQLALDRSRGSAGPIEVADVHRRREDALSRLPPPRSRSAAASGFSLLATADGDLAPELTRTQAIARRSRFPHSAY